ncbi:MAG: hypothetical protein ACKVIQ_09325, partial [Acidimicrobiales bacterium]
QYTSEPFIAFLNDTLKAGGLDPSISLLATGYFFAYPWTETLRVANELPGGMSRTNVMLAARSIDIYHPGVHPCLTNQGQTRSFLTENKI